MDNFQIAGLGIIVLFLIGFVVIAQRAKKDTPDVDFWGVDEEVEYDFDYDDGDVLLGEAVVPDDVPDEEVEAWIEEDILRQINERWPGGRGTQ